MTNEECIFCKIVSGSVPCDKVWENERFLAFADIKPVGPGHTLIVPKKHFDKLVDLDKEASREYIESVQEVGRVLMKEFNADGFNIALNNGKSAGQVIDHVHFHILPRREGDNLKGVILP